MCQRSPLRPYFDVSPAARAGSLVGDNEPHSVTDASDYTIPVRGEQRGMHHVAIEIRRTLSLTKWFSAGGWDSSRDCCRKHINESSPSLKPQTSFHPPQKKPCVPVGVTAGIVNHGGRRTPDISNAGEATLQTNRPDADLSGVRPRPARSLVKRLVSARSPLSRRDASGASIMSPFRWRTPARCSISIGRSAVTLSKVPPPVRSISATSQESACGRCEEAHSNPNICRGCDTL
jgi:hypothetical protein